MSSSASRSPAIAKRPNILLCDEPTGALDSQTGVLVLEAGEQIVLHPSDRVTDGARIARRG